VLIFVAAMRSYEAFLRDLEAERVASPRLRHSKWCRCGACPEEAGVEGGDGAIADVAGETGRDMRAEGATVHKKEATRELRVLQAQITISHLCSDLCVPTSCYIFFWRGG
jgi:hypothetical protein